MSDKLKAWLWLVGLLVVVALYLGWRTEERRIGARDLATQNAERAVDSLNKQLATDRRVFVTDTVRVLRSTRTVDTLLEHRVDTAIVHHSDTVKITVKEAVAIQDTIKACTAVVISCGVLRAREQQRGDSLQSVVNLLKKASPSLFARCGVTVGYGAVYADGIKAGPGVLAGCKIVP